MEVVFLLFIVFFASIRTQWEYKSLVTTDRLHSCDKTELIAEIVHVHQSQSKHFFSR